MVKSNQEKIFVRAPKGAHIVVVRGRVAEEMEDDLHVVIPEWQLQGLIKILEVQVLQALTAHFGGRPVSYDWVLPEGAFHAVEYGTNIPLTVYVDGEEIPILIRRIGEFSIIVERVVRSTWSARG